MRSAFPKECELLYPVIALFQKADYATVLEAKLSRKRIDVLFIPIARGHWISVELKVRDWKTALWQAALNIHLADRSYVALWHTSTPSALSNRELFQSYGVGIVSVSRSQASIVLDGRCLPSSTRSRQQELILEARAGKKEGRLDSVSVLSA